MAARTQVPVISITTSSQTSGAQATLQSAEAGVATAVEGSRFGAGAPRGDARASAGGPGDAHQGAAGSGTDETACREGGDLQAAVRRCRGGRGCVPARRSTGPKRPSRRPRKAWRRPRHGLSRHARPCSQAQAAIEAARAGPRPGGCHEIQRRLRRGASNASQGCAGQGAARP